VWLHEGCGGYKEECESFIPLQEAPIGLLQKFREQKQEGTWKPVDGESDIKDVLITCLDCFWNVTCKGLKLCKGYEPKNINSPSVEVATKFLDKFYDSTSPEQDNVIKIKKEIDPVTGQEMTVTVLKPGGPLYNRNI
jgi:hypothetical protein